MTPEDARRLLDRIGVLGHACDLDLLVFFARHPRALLTSEQLAAWLGYGLKQIVDSLEILLRAGLLRRTQNHTHAARMYILVVDDTTAGWLPSLLQRGSTREGRLAMLEALGRRAPHGTGIDGPSGSSTPETTAAPRPPVVRGEPDETPGTKNGMKARSMERANG